MLKKIELEPCEAPFWAPEGHSQTIIGYYLPFDRPQTKPERFTLELSQGDQVQCELYANAENENASVVYLFHGLGGSTQSPYMPRTAAILQRLGHHVYLMNHRGCGDGESLARHPYHSGRAEDLSRLIEYGRESFPKRKHIAIGFSLSGNALLLLQAGVRGAVRPDLGIAVNAPIDLDTCARLLHRGINRVYDQRFMRDLRQAIQIKKHYGFLPRDFKIPRRSRLYDFDELYTAPAGGFENRADYYAKCSANQYLHQIKTPTVMIMAKNDPFVSAEDYIKAQNLESPHLQVSLQNSGGHMGFVHRKQTPLGTRFWLDYAISELICSV